MIRLATFLAILLLPSVALAADATPEALVGAWGNWPLFVGIGVALFVRAWQTAQPLVWDRVPSRYRPLIAFVIAGLPAFSAALLAGGTWLDAVLALVGAWTAATGAADAIRLALGKPGTEP